MAELMTITPGMVLPDPEFKRVAEQHGGILSSQPTIRRMPTDAEIKAAALAGDDDPAFASRPIYRQNFADGTYIEVRPKPGGQDYEVLDYKPSQRFQQAQTAATAARPPARTPEQQATDAATAANATEEQRQREVNARLPGPNPNGTTEEERRGQDPAYETDADRRKRGQDRIAQQGRDAQTAQAAEAAARPAVTTREEVRGGKTYTVQTSVPKDGTAPTIRVFGPDGKEVSGGLPDETGQDTATSVTVNGKPYIRHTVKNPDGSSEVYHTDQSGARVTLPTEGQRELPPGLPPLETSTAAAAHASYLEQVSWAQQQFRDGKLSRQEVIDLLIPSHQAAQSVIDREQQATVNASTARGQDITQEGHRLQAATSQYGQAQQATNDVWKVAPRGGSQSSDVLIGSILLQQLMNRQTQGNAGPVTAPGAPLLAAPLPASVAAAATAAGVMPPNAIGAGAIGDQAAPGAPRPLLGPPPAVGADPMAPIPGVTIFPAPRPGSVAPSALPASVSAAAQEAGLPVITPNMREDRPSGGLIAPGNPPPAIPAPDYGQPGMRVLPPPAVPPLAPGEITMLPGSVQQAYGRSLIEQIMAGVV